MHSLMWWWATAYCISLQISETTQILGTLLWPCLSSWLWPMTSKIVYHVYVLYVVRWIRIHMYSSRDFNIYGWTFETKCSCAPPNVGSNTLKHILLSTAENSLDLRNSSERIDKSLLRKHGITSLNTFRPVQAKYMLHNFRKIMFVRHPLERLVSVYNSKFGTMNYQHTEFQKLFSRTIIRKIRFNAKTEVRRNWRNVTFQELVRFVINLWENGDELDAYLTPISDICFPCGISYDFVGYLENFVDDTQSVFASLSNTYQRITKRSWTHRRSYNETTIRDVYRSIPKTDIFKLSEVYNIDFYMHAYNLDDVLHRWLRCFCSPIASMVHAKMTINFATTIFTRGALHCLLVPSM